MAQQTTPLPPPSTPDYWTDALGCFMHTITTLARMWILERLQQSAP